MRPYAPLLAMILASALLGACERQTSCAPPAVEQDPGACAVAAALISCEGPAGGCSCLSDDTAACPSDVGCGPTDGMTCTNKCAPDEYVMACGGLPRSDGVTYESAPSRCRFVAAVPAGIGYYCCPCS